MTCLEGSAMSIKSLSTELLSKLGSTASHQKDGRLAIIDIGSNAMRAVVYADHSLGAEEVYNEKFRSDLGSLLDSDNINIKHQTYLVLQHFCHIFEQLNVTDIKCVATAVLRNRNNGAELCALIKQRYKIDVIILTGMEEAYLTASGLTLGIPDARGVVADLGGGSLELAEIADFEIDNLASYPLGTRMLDEMSDENTIIDTIKSKMHNHDCENLYLIGGALRLLGRKYIDFVRYPLKNLHNLSIDQQDLLVFLEKIDGIRQINKFHNAGTVDNNAILVLKALVKLFNPRQVIISNYGLKEGVRVLCSNKKQDGVGNIILARALSITGTPKAKIHSLSAYTELIKPLLLLPDTCTLVVIELSVLFIHFFKNIDRTLLANFASEYIMVSDIPFTHRQRVMLALILAQFFVQNEGLFIINLAKKMISKEDYANCQIIASALAIANKVDGPEFSKPTFKFKLLGSRIEIDTNLLLPKATFEKVYYCIKAIAMARQHSSAGVGPL